MENVQYLQHTSGSPILQNLKMQKSSNHIENQIQPKQQLIHTSITNEIKKKLINLPELNNEAPFSLSKNRKNCNDNSVTTKYAIENLKHRKTKHQNQN